MQSRLFWLSLAIAVTVIAGYEVSELGEVDCPPP